MFVRPVALVPIHGDTWANAYPAVHPNDSPGSFCFLAHAKDDDVQLVADGYPPTLFDAVAVLCPDTVELSFSLIELQRAIAARLPPRSNCIGQGIDARVVSTLARSFWMTMSTRPVRCSRRAQQEQGAGVVVHRLGEVARGMMR